MNYENRDELFSIVRRTVYDARTGLDMVKQLLDHGFPAADKKEEYYFLRYEFPDLFEIQERMNSLARVIEKEDTSEDRISSGESLIKDIADRITSLRVILQDLFSNMDNASEMDQSLHYSLLATLTYLKKPLEYQVNRLYQLFEAEGIWGPFDGPNLYDESDDDSAEEMMDLWADENFYNLFLNVKNALVYYQEQHPDEDLEAFIGYVQDSFSGFADHQKHGVFSFAFEYPYGDEVTLFYFQMEDQRVQVIRSHESFTSEDEGEEYSDWAFSISEDGSTEGTMELGSNDLFSFIDGGARLSISLPEEYILPDYPEEY